MPNFSGVFTTNQTANDGDSITGTVTINSGCTFTITAGATISVTGAFSIIVGTGVLYAVGTETSIITLQSSLADPALTSWNGMYIGASGGTATIDLVKIISASDGFSISGNFTCTTTLGHIWFDVCNRYFADNAATTLATTWAGVMATSTSQSFLGQGARNATVTRMALNLTGALSAGATTTVVCNGLVVHATAYVNSISTTGSFTLNDFYLKVGGSSYLIGVTGTGTQNMNRGVAYHSNAHGVQNTTANCTLGTNNCDWISNLQYALRTATQATATINSTSDYFAGNYYKPEAIVDQRTVAGGNTQVQQSAGTITITTAVATPNKPLTINNISESSLTANGVTIGFDSTAGGTGYRIDAIGFVEYGVASGVYTQSSLDDFPSDEEIRKCWTGWSTKYIFAQTGHSVVLANLKEATKYYYRCGIVDPLGRVGYSSEGDFTTPASGIAITNQQSDDYSATFTQQITISCTATADNVSATCNDKTIALTDLGGGSWSKTVYAGAAFGECTNKPIYFTARTDAGALGTATSPSNQTVAAASTKTTTLISEVSTTLTTAGYTPTITLINEKEFGGTIISLLHISVPTYSTATIDGIRTAISTDSSGWAGSVTAVEQYLPASTTHSLIVYKMTHS